MRVRSLPSICLGPLVALVLLGCGDQCVRNSDCADGLDCQRGLCLLSLADGGVVAPPGDSPDPGLRADAAAPVEDPDQDGGR